MKSFCLFLVLAFIAVQGFAQYDTLYMNNEKIACQVREITEDAVRYSYPGEELLNSSFKNSIQKIVFKNGREQVFSEGTSLKTIKTVDDYENVSITRTLLEIRGLYKVGEVSSKAKGTTTLSNQERVKERAYRKMKIEAAMMGANIIYLTHQRTEGNRGGGYYQSGSSAETNLSGVAYTNLLPSYDKFLARIRNNRSFVTREQAKLWSSAADMSKSDYKKRFVIRDIFNENGLIMVKAELEGVKKYDQFRVVGFDEHQFYIYYSDKATAYNIAIPF